MDIETKIKCCLCGELTEKAEIKYHYLIEGLVCDFCMLNNVNTCGICGGLANESGVCDKCDEFDYDDEWLE